MATRYGIAPINPLENFQEGLSRNTIQAMGKFIKSQSVAGTNNWEKMTTFQFYSMDTSANSLIDWKGFRNAVVPRDASWGYGLGWQFTDGSISYLDTGFAQQDMTYHANNFTGAYMLYNRDYGNQDRVLYGCRILSGTQTQTHVQQSPVSNPNRIGYAEQTNNDRTWTGDDGSILNSTLYVTTHIPTQDGGGANTDAEFWKNGVLTESSNSVNARTLSAFNIYVGARNFADASVDLSMDCNVLCWFNGVDGDFDHLAFYNDLEILKTDMNIYSTETIKVFERMTNLVDQEKRAMGNFIDSQVSSGNWPYINEFVHFGMQTEANSLVGWKIKSMTKLSGPWHSSGTGFSSDGTAGYAINTNFNPNEDATASGDTQFQGAFYEIFNRSSTTYYGFGGINLVNNFGIRHDGAVANRNRYYLNGAEELYQCSCNTEDHLWMLDTSLGALMFDGVSVDFGTAGTVDVSGNLYALGINNGGSVITFNGTQSSWVFGDATNFNHTDFYDNLVALNTALALIYSSEAEAVFARMNSTILLDAEKRAIASFVDSQVVSGNWALLDEFIHYGLQSRDNALIGWKLKTQTAVASPIHNPGFGFKFNGTTQYLNTNFNPFTDRVVMAQDNNNSGVFLESVVDTGQTESLYGGFPSGGTTMWIFYTLTQFRFHNYNAIQLASTRDYIPGLYSQIRTDSSTQTVYVDGVSGASSGAKAMGSDTSEDIYVGAANLSGVASQFSTARLSSFYIGAAIGFDHSNYYDNLVILNANLAAI